MSLQILAIGLCGLVIAAILIFGLTRTGPEEDGSARTGGRDAAGQPGEKLAGGRR